MEVFKPAWKNPYWYSAFTTHSVNINFLKLQPDNPVTAFDYHGSSVFVKCTRVGAGSVRLRVCFASWSDFSAVTGSNESEHQADDACATDSEVLGTVVALWALNAQDMTTLYTSGPTVERKTWDDWEYLVSVPEDNPVVYFGIFTPD